MKVKLAPAAAGILSLLLLLSWLLLSGLNLNSARYDVEMEALHDFYGLERALNREVLTSRTGLSRNYDELVRTGKALNAALDRLRQATDPDDEMREATGELGARVREQEVLVEEFKTKNALLRNSCAFFELFASRLAASDHKEVAASATTLSAAMLHLTLDTSQSAAKKVQDRLDELAGLQDISGDADAIRAVIAHGELLRHLLPETDAVLRALIAAASTREQEVLRALIVKRQLAARASARQYRILLYTISLTLLGVLVYLGLQLRARAASLQRRAAFEHVVADISTRFITSSHYELATHIISALEALARLGDADRAYFVMASRPTQIYRWSRSGDFPEGWPANALDLAAHFPRGEEGTVHVVDTGKVRNNDPSSDAVAALAAAGLRSWLCFPGSTGQRTNAILGFDALGANKLWRWTRCAQVRSAFDAIANTIDRVSLEQEKQRLEAGLQQARRMETLGAFASGIAHNFNNIIGAILGYTEMAHSHVSSDGRPAANLVEIRHAGERARELIGQILKFGRRDTGRVPTCVRKLVAETESLLRASLPADFGLVIRSTLDNTMVSAERAQLQQVILNLCNNAAQAMDQPGDIEIEVSAREVAGELRVGHRKLGPGRFAIISISDRGRGMDSATLERIFEPFFTTRPDGNGLGLATVREIVLEYGGAIEVKSVVGAGTRFDVWLPSASSREPAAAEPPPRTRCRGVGETILVLETDRERLLRVEEILAALGYEPVGFSYLAEAVAACRFARNRFDAALICHRPGAGAPLDFATALHGIVPALPIVLATPSTQDIEVRSLATSGISELVHSPPTSSELAHALSRALAASAAQLSKA